MKIIFYCFILTLSVNAFSSTKDCSKVYKKKYHKIAAYTLVKVYETKTLCGFHVTYNQDEDSGDISKGSALNNQIIESKDSKLEIADKSFLKSKKFDICEHSIPVNNQLDCYVNKDLFSLIAKRKSEKVSSSSKLEL